MRRILTAIVTIVAALGLSLGSAGTTSTDRHPIKPLNPCVTCWG
jgi:hypothetical protein